MEFKSVAQVEEVLHRPLTEKQAKMIQHYIDTGERPQAGSCVWCDEADMRLLTAQMDLYQ